MSEISKLIDSIIRDIKKKQIDAEITVVSTEKAYTSRPIKRLSQMPPSKKSDFEALRKVGKNIDSYSSSDALFRIQAELMKDYEDFSGALPCDPYIDKASYTKLSDSQLHSYFSWRTRIRMGERVPFSFAFGVIYISEIVNQIGISDAFDGYKKLLTLSEIYKTEKCGNSYYYYISFDKIINDYIVFYGLDSSLINSKKQKIDECIGVISDFQAFENETRKNALANLSSYSYFNSKFAKKYPDDALTLALDVISTFIEAYGKSKFTTLLFGHCSARVYFMFDYCIVQPQKSDSERVYEINGINKYIYKNGIWKHKCYNVQALTSKRITSILKTLDSFARTEYGFQSPTKQGITTEDEDSIIKGVLADFLNRKKEREKKELLEKARRQKEESLASVVIDLSSLDKIRSDAKITCEKLITDENDIEYEEEAAIIKPDIYENEFSLDANEVNLLIYLLYGKEYTQPSDKLLTKSILADRINEKLFDLFSDTVILCDGDELSLIDDYIPELKEHFSL